MMTHDEMIAVIQYHKDGGDIEFYNYDNPSILYVEDSPIWNFAKYYYRPCIEPKQKQVIVLETWLCKTISKDACDSECFFTVEANEGEMQSYFKDKYSSKAIKLLSTREVEIDV